MREGDPADSFFVIRHGRVAMEIFVPQRGAVTIETIDDGDLLGWSWLVPPFRATWTLARSARSTRSPSTRHACAASRTPIRCSATS